MKINWVVKKWSALIANEIYFILRLRSEVFVVEQDCVYQDIDKKDLEAIHIMGYFENKLIAYSKCVVCAYLDFFEHLSVVILFRLLE